MKTALLCLLVAMGAAWSATPITSAKQYLEYLDAIGKLPAMRPKSVVVVYSRPLLESILSEYSHEQGTGFLSDLYLLEGGIGVLKAGFGAPALIHRLEELVALGAERIITVGKAGALTDDLQPGDVAICLGALGEDGVSHLYLEEGVRTAAPLPFAIDHFLAFLSQCDMQLRRSYAWSFPVPFLETKEDLARVAALGCDTVEMEAAALYAFCKAKQVEGIALFVISDSLAGGVWRLEVKSDSVREKLRGLADLAIEYGRREARSTESSPHQRAS